jgi:D-arabinose 1-dehydrogenase-like Zn-dependent alcohol dehydrogenase
VNTQTPIALPEEMSAARLHNLGAPLQIDRIAVPVPRPTDVLVEVRACGVVPNLRRVIGNFFGTEAPDRKRFPPLPAIFGLDAVGVVAAVGDEVKSVQPGQRVYVNPARGCGSCRMCRTGRYIVCQKMTMQGYFGRSHDIMRSYPFGGLSQYQTAPQDALVLLPDTIALEEAARFGYLGTSYSTLKKVDAGPGDTVIITGVSGMLGVGAVLLALAMGVKKILGVGRNIALLGRVRALNPVRIFVHSLAENITPDPDHPENDPFQAWVRDMTGGERADAVVDCLPPGAPPETLVRAIYALRRGGKVSSSGAVTANLPISGFWMVANQITFTGNSWFSTTEAEEMAGLAAIGRINFKPFIHHISPLNQVNEALMNMSENRDGGFANYVIDNTRTA